MTSRLRLSRLAFAFGLLMAAAPLARAQDTAAPPPEIADTISVCAGCHGEDGRPTREDTPIIWGQEYYYLYVQLKDFAAGRRDSEIMTPIAGALSKDQMKALAQYFSERTWPRLSFAASDQDVAEGRRVATAGQCTQCHLGAFTGNSRVPRLADQSVTYLEKTMLDFKHNRRKNAADMAALLESFPEKDIKAMAHFLAGL